MATKEVYRKGTQVEGRGATREARGIALAKDHFEEIVKIRPWTWSVPPSSGQGFYEVNLRYEVCSCPDRVPEGQRCKHVIAALYVKARTGQCVGCRGTFRHLDLIEVMDYHESLTWFEGDILCIDCARATGVL
jgi:hypothetical protein